MEWAEILQRIRNVSANRDEAGVKVTQVAILDILEDIAYKMTDEEGNKKVDWYNAQYR